MTERPSGDASERELRLRRLAERRRSNEPGDGTTPARGRRRASKAPVARMLLGGGSTAAFLALTGTMAMVEAPAPQPAPPSLPTVASSTSTTSPPRRIIKVIYRPVVVPTTSTRVRATPAVRAPRPVAAAPRYVPAPPPVPAAATAPRDSAPATTVTTTRAT
jgi:hypothetical protein